jgi:hypothetical protein
MLPVRLDTLSVLTEQFAAWLIPTVYGISPNTAVKVTLAEVILSVRLPELLSHMENM